MKTIDINGKQIDVIIERKKVKNINLRVRKGTIFVSANKKVSKKYILEFVNRNLDFIEKAISEENKKLRYSIPKIQNNYQGEIYLFGEKFYYRYIKSNLKNIKIVDKEILIYCFNEDSAQKLFENFLKEILREYVLRIDDKIYDIFKNYGVKKPEINYRKMKSRWGTCYYEKGKIFLNTALVTAPKECINYVLFHEYTHFLYPNHKKEFYDFLLRFIPNYKDIKKVLNTYDEY